VPVGTAGAAELERLSWSAGFGLGGFCESAAGVELVSSGSWGDGDLAGG
jgi:hypothetical protein